MPESKLNPDQIWLAALGELQLQVTKSTFDTWLRDIILLRYAADANEFVIGVRAAHVKDWLESRLLSAIRRILTGICGRSATVRFELSQDEENTSEQSAMGEDEDSLAQTWMAAGIPGIFMNVSLETLDWSQPALQKPELQEYVQRAPDYFRAGVGLTLIGPTGVGKTHIAVGLLKKAIDVNWSGHFIGTVSLLDEIRSTFDSARQGSGSHTERNIIRKLSGVRLLVLDDLRIDSLTAWGRDRLYAVLNPRWERGLPTITTSNYSPDELAHPMGRDRLGMDEGTLSRLVRTALTIRLDGVDYRLEQKRRAITTIRAQRSTTQCDEEQ